MPFGGLLRAGGTLNRILVPFGTLKQAVTSRAMTVDASANSSGEPDAPNLEIAGGVQKKHASLQIDDGALGCVIGKKGATIRRLESEIGASIKVESKGSGDNNIFVTADNNHAAQNAVQAIEEVFQQALASHRLGVNHFVCIPVNTATVQAAFQDLKGKITELNNATDAKIDSSIFISEKKLHLTILVLKLYSNKSRDLAAKVLQDAGRKARELLGQQSLNVELRGLKTMQGKTANADVLYVDVETASNMHEAARPVQGGSEKSNSHEDEKTECRDGSSADSVSLLKQVCREVIQTFEDAGLLQPADKRKLMFRDPLLHVTVMNSKYRKAPVDGVLSSEPQDSDSSKAKPPVKARHKFRFPKRVHFDASTALQRFANASLGNVNIDNLELSSMSTVDESGFYSCLTRTSLLIDRTGET